MLPQKPLLVILVELIDLVQLPQPPVPRGRGRPKVYSDRQSLSDHGNSLSVQRLQLVGLSGAGHGSELPTAPTIAHSKGAISLPAHLGTPPAGLIVVSAPAA